MIDWLITQITTNPFFNGVIGAAVLTGMGMWFRQTASTIRTWVARYCTCKFSVTNEDNKLYDYVNLWLVEKRLHKSPRRLVVKQAHISRSALLAPVLVGGSEKANQYTTLADNDSYLVWYHKRPVLIEFESKVRDNAGILRTVTLTFYLRGPKWLSELTTGFMRDTEVHETRRSHLVLRAPTSYGDWTYRYVSFRKLSTIMAEDRTVQLLVEDIQKFLNSREKYEKLGKPYRRNFLLHGPPGTGKTSLVMAIASWLERDLYLYTNLGAMKSFTDSYSNICHGSIIAFEDVDQAGANVKSREDDSSDDVDENGVTMSDLLNVLDGGHSVEGAIVFLLTNYPERLDPAITRPGRVDRSFRMAEVSIPTIREYVTRNLDVDWDDTLELALRKEAIADGKVNPATAQEIIYQHLLNAPTEVPLVIADEHAQ